MAGIEVLSDREIQSKIKAVKLAGKAVTISDGGGLSLQIQPSGAGWWRLRYWLASRENRLSLGTYPEISLATARKRRREAQDLIALGVDPSERRKAKKVEVAQQRVDKARAAEGLAPIGSFEEVARRWFEIKKSDWAVKYAEKVIARLENKVFPHLGARPIREITPPELLRLLRALENEGIVETAHRVRDTCSQVFRFAVAEGIAASDPARDLADALKTHTTEHIASITEPKRFGDLLRAIEGYSGTPVVKAALKLQSLVFLRPGNELRQARWGEFDLEEGIWTVPAERMKRRKKGKLNGPDHVVPLSTQAIQVLRDLHPYTGTCDFVLIGMRKRGNKPISDNTLNAALDSMGFGATEDKGPEHRAHGFRASARTMLVERLNVDPDVIEAQLAHSVRNPLGRAYDRTQFIEQRRKVMQTWADYCDKLREEPQRLRA